jgi:hypothetical protein
MDPRADADHPCHHLKRSRPSSLRQPEAKDFAKNVPNANEWLYRVQLKMRPDLFQKERSNSVRSLQSGGAKKTNWPTRALKDIGMDRRTVDRALKKLAEENDHVKELLETPGILPDLGDHPYPYP